MISKLGKVYTWKPDLPDQRDFLYKVQPLDKAATNVIDLRPLFPAPYDQLALGGCTGNGIAGIWQYDDIKQKLPNANIIPSRLFIYYNERVIEGTVKYDAGAMIRDGIKTVAKQGVCSETTWPYNIKKFAVKPSQTAYNEAAKHKAIVYQRVNQDVASIQNCLTYGFPIVFGFTVYESFESDNVTKTGIVPMPLKTESVLGGHCCVIVGIDLNKSLCICRNSWGVNWGDKGYFYMPIAYLTDTNLSADFWIIKSVS